MNPNIFSHFLIRSKSYLFVFFCFFSYFFFFQHFCYADTGWGPTGTTEQYEGKNWDELSYDMNGIKFTTFIPNYSKVNLNNDCIFLNGKLDVAGDHFIAIPFLVTSNYPQTIDEVVEWVQNSNLDDIAIAADPAESGADFVVDLIPINEKNDTYHRYYFWNNRRIELSSNANIKNREKFFQSVRIFK